MALEIRKIISDVHEQAVLCVAYNPLQRQIFTGSQDSTIKCWQSENGELVRTLREHAGWVTGLEFAADIRVLFSCSIDGFVVAWSPKGEVLDRERAGGKEAGVGVETGRKQSGPLYCLCWDPRRQQLVVGANGHIWVFSVHTGDSADLGREKTLQLVGTLKDDKGRPPHAMSGSEDPVRGIISTDTGKIFSAGYDRTLRVWDTTRLDAPLAASSHGDQKRKPGRTNSGDSLMKNTHTTVNSHDGAISAVTFDPDDNWLITGGFDRSVRIWACDGKRVSKIDGFSDTLTGLAYAQATRTLWMSANSAQPVVYDPRTLTDISKYLQARPAQQEKDRADQRIQRLFTIKETGEVLAATSGRQLVIWRYIGSLYFYSRKGPKLPYAPLSSFLYSLCPRLFTIKETGEVLAATSGRQLVIWRCRLPMLLRALLSPSPLLPWFLSIPWLSTIKETGEVLAATSGRQLAIWRRTGSLTSLVFESPNALAHTPFHSRYTPDRWSFKMRAAGGLCLRPEQPSSLFFEGLARPVTPTHPLNPHLQVQQVRRRRHPARAHRRCRDADPQLPAGATWRVGDEHVWRRHVGPRVCRIRRHCAAVAARLTDESGTVREHRISAGARGRRAVRAVLCGNGLFYHERG
jgi:hypothetical protein